MILLSGCGGAPSALPTAATGPANPVPPAVERLLRLMRDRLDVTHDVARTKWNTKRPVGDPEREQTLLRGMEEKGQEHGLDPKFTRTFFSAQIAAARLVQEADFARWRVEGRGPFADASDLAALRMRIDDINRNLLGALAEAWPRLGDASTREQLRPWAREVIVGEGITGDVRAAAIATLPAP
jgi:chorismate mutase